MRNLAWLVVAVGSLACSDGGLAPTPIARGATVDGWPLSFGSTTHVMLRDADMNHHFTTTVSFFAGGTGAVLATNRDGVIDVARAVAHGNVGRGAGQVNNMLDGGSPQAQTFDVLDPLAGNLVVRPRSDATFEGMLAIEGGDTSGWATLQPTSDPLLCISDDDCAQYDLPRGYVCLRNACLPQPR